MAHQLPAQQALGIEATDTHTEALRLAEFAKYKPTFYWDGGTQEVELSGTTWRLLAAAEIEGAEDSHFLSVISKWTLSAETVIPPVDHTQILDSAGADEKHLSDIGESEAVRISRVRRVLVPKRISKDSLLTEDVIVERIGCGTYARFFPAAATAADIPFYYPLVHEYALGYIEPKDESHAAASTLVVLVRELSPGSAVATKKQQLIWRDLIKRLFKWTVTERFGYQKRVAHDVMVDYETYTSKYQELKAKYAAFWVDSWPEQTDPRKFVYEDIAIASWIICVWQQQEGLRPSFVDLGCGNGLLVHLLNSEGYVGYGVDQCSRKVWAHYGPSVDLRAQTLEPYTYVADVDWIIGNHADELVPWIPVIAARSGAKFIVVPCCPHDFSGCKMAFSVAAGQSKYHMYSTYIGGLARRCGFEVEQEYLRIPSTKNLAIVGRSRCVADASQVEIDAMVQAGKQEFVARVPDSVKNKVRLAKAQARKVT
ncbi:tRNA(Ser) Um(44) 2'-O-methyltransferase [Coemansia sp. BCRC 34301]|nr:tRNA(Ser) Um(44) 2'-O-methyltransferase [Coemansia sp. BCRC 34301]